MGEMAFIGRKHNQPQLWIVPQVWRARWLHGVGRRIRAATDSEVAMVQNRPLQLSTALKMKRRKEQASRDSEEVQEPHPPEPPPGHLCEWCGQRYKNLGAHQRFCKQRGG